MQQNNLESHYHTDVTLLEHEHRLLDERVHELAVQDHLTPEETIELARLKKEKLRLKDLLEDVEAEQQTA